MVYTFIGNSDYIDKEINKIFGSDLDIEDFDLSNCDISFDNIIANLNTFSLFDKRIVRISNIDKLDDYDSLIKYIENPSDNILIIVSNKELDKRKKITKVLKDKTNYKELFNYDVVGFVRDNLSSYKMSNKDINILIDYCSNDINRIYNELLKLKMYKVSSKEITFDDIKKIVRRNYDSTIFLLIDNINLKNKKEIFRIYNELLFLGDTPEKVMYTISNHYRLLFQISVKIRSLSDNDIISLYHMHPYRLTKLKEQLRMISGDEIIYILDRLASIEINYKLGKTSIDNEMIMFFENI